MLNSSRNIFQVVSAFWMRRSQAPHLKPSGDVPGSAVGWRVSSEGDGVRVSACYEPR